MVSVIIGGRLVDRIGVRAVMIPGLLILGVATWELSFITLYSPYWWLQAMLVLRGIALGLTVQPLTVFGLSEVRPRQLGQASSMNTVMRSVSSSLGIAVLATLVQSETKVHYARLAEQVTASSVLGQMLPRLQALFVARGADAASAQSAALLLVSRLVQRQSFVLAIQDAFLLTVVIIGLAIISVLFVRGSRKKPATIPEAAPAATAVPAEEEESSTPTFAMAE